MTTTRINELTEAQWAEVHRLRSEWLAAGTCCEPADRAASEAAITEMYRLMGKPAPQFVWTDSPATASLAIWLLSGKAGDSLGASLGASLRDSLRDSLGASLYQRFWGQHEASWIAFYDVPRRLDLVTYSNEVNARLGLWAALARSCGWWWPYGNVCVISERPALVKTETWDAARGTVRLHSADGPAMRFRDGWPVYSWHGRQVPAWVVEEPAVERIAGEENVEVRRCAIESLGWEKFVSDAELQLIGTEPDPGNPGFDIELYDVPERLWGSRIRLLLAWNGTAELDGNRRRFGITAAAGPDTKTPRAAAAWGYDDPDSPVRVTPEVYAQIARRT